MNRPFTLVFGLCSALSLLLLAGCPAPSGIENYPPIPSVTVEVIEYEPMYPAPPKTMDLDKPLDQSNRQDLAGERQVVLQPEFLQAELSFKFAANVAEENVKLPPIDDLEPQVEQYIAKLKKTLEDLDGSVRFTDDAEALYRDASTLSIIALALALSPEKSKFKEAAPGIIQAAGKLQTVKNVDEAAKVLAELEKATTSQSTTSLKWENVAPLKPLMKAVPNINTLIKRNLRTEAALKKGDRKVLEGSATLAVIAQGSMANVAETIKPDAEKDWQNHCLQFRDASLKVNGITRSYMDGKAEFEAVEKAFENLTDSCNSCHILFFSGTIPLD